MYREVVGEACVPHYTLVFKHLSRPRYQTRTPKGATYFYLCGNTSYCKKLSISVKLNTGHNARVTGLVSIGQCCQLLEGVEFGEFLKTITKLLQALLRLWCL